MSRNNIAFARALRRAQTDAEKLLWRHLRARRLQGVKFRRQYPLGPYIVDFVAVQSRLVIELDGGQHLHNLGDEARDAWLSQCHFHVLRFWNHEVLGNLDGVLITIVHALKAEPRRTDSSDS